MPSYHDIPDRVREFVAGGPDQPWTDELTEVAVGYAALCREAVDRLRRCRDYLRRGMRSEAVHLAGCQPPLADLVPALDLPEADAWNRACGRAGLPAAPRLRAGDDLPALRAAADADRALGPLLSAYRLRALAGSPARERLESARALLARDPGNPCWAEAVAALEAVRLRELRARAKAAFRAADLSALDGVAAELAAAEWTVEVPEDLRVGLARAVKQTRRQAARDRLAPLLGEILAAQSAGDRDRCAALLGDWAAVLAEHGLTAPPDLQAQVAPAVQWLASADRRDEIGERLRAAQGAIERAADEQAGGGDGRSWLGRLRRPR